MCSHVSVPHSCILLDTCSSSQLAVLQAGKHTTQRDAIQALSLSMMAHLQPLCLMQLYASRSELDGREPVEVSLNMRHEQHGLLTSCCMTGIERRLDVLQSMGQRRAIVLTPTSSPCQPDCRALAVCVRSCTA